VLVLVLVLVLDRTATGWSVAFVGVDPRPTKNLLAARAQEVAGERDGAFAVR